jgi:hypothetical protein
MLKEAFQCYASYASYASYAKGLIVFETSTNVEWLLHLGNGVDQQAFLIWSRRAKVVANGSVRQVCSVMRRVNHEVATASLLTRMAACVLSPSLFDRVLTLYGQLDQPWQPTPQQNCEIARYTRVLVVTMLSLQE